MVRRIPIAFALLLAACGTGDVSAARRGRLELELAARPLPAVARYCARDSVLSLVGFDDDWSAAVAVRTGWPVDTAARFTIDSALGAVGTASVAARSMRDSTGGAVVAASGTVTLDTGAVMAGRFDAATSDSTVPRLAGRFESPGVLAVCP